MTWTTPADCALEWNPLVHPDVNVSFAVSMIAGFD